MSVSIKVSIRCRPFVKDDQLGVRLMQTGEETGEVELLNSKYATTRFAFSYAWWSAYGFDRHLTGEGGKGEATPGDQNAADEMKLVDQKMAYDSVGVKIMDDLMQGNAIVLFAYGLSGSGKTFTVFGPDAVDIPEAWFKHKTPHPLWGIFPHLAFDLFEKKQDGWKISMKYFQNIVGIVKDLMSPMGKEMPYKTGMRKDKDGFMDIDWCESLVLESWDDLRNAFMAANARKAIAATQFNHQSTRGHCIMTLEVEMPHPDVKGTKQRGRIYVCDLAGTEPAGDIVAAEYKKVTYDNGEIEHKYMGPDVDQSKTKQLQDQGKKINLSLSEMANFFLKMAQAVKEKKLKPGQSIPGCNTYFLCKFLKDTMLQAKTYLFCAIRPEVEYHKYTFATLGFAKNASVIKLQPKKATSNQSKREMQLMEELEKMKAMMQGLKESGGGGDTAELDKLLAEKQAQLMTEMKGEADNIKKAEMEKQKAQYASRGISLSFFEAEPQAPHLVNLDEDSFRNRRFLFLFTKPLTSFGKTDGDIKPLNMNMCDDHCSVQLDGPEDVSLIGGKGPVYHNGAVVAEGQKVPLKKFDRVVIGQDVMLFKLAFCKSDKPEDEPEERVAIQEYRKAVQEKDSAYQEQAKKLEEDKRKLMEELEKMKRDGFSAADIDSKRQAVEAWKAIDETMMEMVPVLSRMNDMCSQVGRDMLTFKLSLQQPKVDMPYVKVQVTNTETNTVVFLDPFEISANMNMLADQILALKTNDDYTVPEDQEIVKLLFDSSYEIGSCTNFLLHCTLCMETDEEDRHLDAMKSVIPYNKIGTLDVFWKPMSSPDDPREPEEVVETVDLIGKPWTYKLSIGKIENLPTQIAEAHVVYEFNGQRYVTDVVHTNEPKREVDFDYSEILHVDVVDEDFLKYLDEVEFKFEIFIKPWVMCTLPPLSNKDATLCANLGIAMSASAAASDPKVQLDALKKENAELKAQLDLMREGKYEEAYKAHVAQLMDKINALEAAGTNPSVVCKLEAAKEADKQINTSAEEKEA